MFHRVPSFSFIAVITTALIFLLVVLFASPLSSPGTAHADHSSPPMVSIAGIEPEVGEEGGHLRVTLRLSRPLTADEKWCYPAISGAPPRDEVCIEGGIWGKDSYNDHLPDENTETSDENFAFVFRGSETEKRLSLRIKDDQCITPGRTMRVSINSHYRLDTYGYTIDTTEHTVRIAGNDETNGTLVDDGGKCAAVDDGVTEDIFTNQAPRFGTRTLTSSVDENTASGESIGSPVTADDEENDTLEYSLTGTDASHFDINSSTGQILTYGALDHEDRDTYHLAVQVTDSKDIVGDPDSAIDDSIDLTITVNDVNEAPVFDSGVPATLNVVENTAAGDNIGQAITATDPDDGDSVSYSLDDGGGAAFDIDNTTGQIKTKDALDKETKDTYNVTVTATDSGGLTDTHTVTITVTDDTTEPPTFDEEYGDGQSSLTREVAENTAAGEPVGARVSANDDDGDTITYSLTGTDASSFDIDASTGQIKTRDALDYETTQSYSIIVSITDSKDDVGNAEDPALEDATIDVTINVTDVNEGPAFAADAPITQEVAENTAAGIYIGTAYTATDPERDTLTYTLDTGDGAAFEIDSNGQIKTKADLDHETKSSYSVTIRVTDGKAADGSTETNATIDDTHDVTITVTDLDEDGSITFSAEPPSAGTTLTAALADDDGVKSSPAVTWKWESSPNGTDTWTEFTGETTYSYTPGTDDIGAYLRVTATYDDEFGTKTAEKVSQAVLTAPPTNQNPSFASNAATTLSVAENTLAGTNIGDAYTATQADSKGTLVYSLDTAGADNFDIDSTNGQLRTKTVFDYETDARSYTVTVSVTDGLDDHSLSDGVVDGTITVTISVTDVNEAPQFADGAADNLEVSEDTAPSTAIGDYEATDPETNTLTYSVTGTGSESFQIDSYGQLQVKETLNHEGQPSYTLTVSVSDGKDAEDNADTTVDDTHEVTITVTNVFEAPRFDDELPVDETSITRSVPENTEAGQPVGDPVSATDDEGDTLTYELGGTDSFSFDSASGQIKTKAGVDLDHETKDSYSVTVSVGDGKDDQNVAEDPPVMDTEIQVTIQIEDENEPPAFADDAVTDLEVAENTDADQDIGAPFTATDPDEDPADTLTYGLEGTDAASFDIDTSTAQIKTKAALDYESKVSYSVTVTVSDGRDDAGTAEDPPVADTTIGVTITVTDEDDPGTITLSEQQPPSGVELTGTLEDDDDIKADVDVTWVWYSSSDKTTWTVIDGAGTNTYIPQEDDEGKYLKVTATYDDELGSGKTAEAVTQGMVLDRDATNELPAFESGPIAMLSVQENTPAGENIGDPFTATDEDTSDTLTYVLSGTDASSFDIVSTSGQIQTKEVLNYEKQPTKLTYTVTVEVRDSKDPFGNADTRVDDTVDVTINVTDMVIPAIPAAPTVTPTPGAAAGLTVTWTAIPDTDVAPVDGYDVQYREKDTQNPNTWETANITVSGTTATITGSGVDYEKTYEVQVRSKNAEGDSGWSPSGEGTIPSRLNVAFSPASQSVDEGSSASYTVNVSPATDRALSIPFLCLAVTPNRGITRRPARLLTFASGRQVKVVLDIDGQRLRPG